MEFSYKDGKPYHEPQDRQTQDDFHRLKKDVRYGVQDRQTKDR